MRNFIIFQDSKVFNKEQVWDEKVVLHKYNDYEIEDITMSIIKIKARKKTLQTGIIITAENKIEALEKYLKMKDLLNG